MQMSHFSRANLTFSSAHLTFLPCKSHISPVQISHFSSAKLTFLPCKSHISSVQISHFSSANLTFLPCKSHISPVQISPFSRANLTFLSCRLNYNHFQTGRITTESWSQSVWGLRTTLGSQTYRSSPQNGRSKSWFCNFKVVLNSTPTTDFLLIEWSQCAWLSTFIKTTAFHYSYICYLDYPAQSLLVLYTFDLYNCV